MQNSPMQSVVHPGSMHVPITDIPLQYPCDAEDKRDASKVLEPPGGRATGAALVLGSAALADPVLPPDPLQMVDLEDDQSDDSEKELGLTHAASLADRQRSRKSSGGRK